jgi:hypothetical protein
MLQKLNSAVAKSIGFADRDASVQISALSLHK